MEYDDRGDLKRKHIHRKPPDHRTQGRSSCHHNSIDKARGLRRKADRASHHRRRKINKEELKKNGNESIMLGSTTCQQKRKTLSSTPQPLSNRKGSSNSNGMNSSSMYKITHKSKKNNPNKPYINPIELIAHKQGNSMSMMNAILDSRVQV